MLATFEGRASEIMPPTCRICRMRSAFYEPTRSSMLEGGEGWTEGESVCCVEDGDWRFCFCGSTGKGCEWDLQRNLITAHLVCTNSRSSIAFNFFEIKLLRPRLGQPIWVGCSKNGIYQIYHRYVAYTNCGKYSTIGESQTL